MTGRLEDMAAFAEVATAGGFAAAARRLGGSTSQLSRRISALEARLGARLFHRTTRALALTEAGSAFLAAVLPLIDAARAADEAVAGLQGAITGTIRVSAPVSLGESTLAPLLNRFMADHPGVAIDLLLDDRSVDLVGEGIDLGLRVSPAMADSGLVARVLRPVARVIVGAPSYLDRHGRPAVPADLAAHVCLLYRNLPDAEQWRFAEDDGLRQYRGPSRLRADNGGVLLRAAIDGIGLVMLPDFIVAEALAAGAVERVLAGAAVPPTALRLVYPPARRLSAKVRTLADFLAAELSAGRAL